MRLRDFATTVFARELADPGQMLLPSPVYLRHIFEVLEEEIAKAVKAQAEAEAVARAAATAVILCDAAPAPKPRVDPSTGETLDEVEHPTPAG